MNVYMYLCVYIYVYLFLICDDDQLINHGVEESVMQRIIDATDGFFNLTEEEKKEFEGTKHVLEPISSGTSFSGTPTNGRPLIWRDYYKFIVHPQFNSPYKPAGFRY